MSHDSVYRISTHALLDDTLDDSNLAAELQFVGHKPMSDGIELLKDNTVVITDVENGGIGLLSPAGEYTSLTKSNDVDWADSVTVAPDGSIWFTDSRLTALIDQFAIPSDQSTMMSEGPYPIYRVPASAYTMD